MKKQEEKEFKQKIKEKGGIIRDNNHAITLIALVITVIVLLILARNFYFNAIWRQFYFAKSHRS